MVKHTPGPWRLSGPDEFGDYTVQPPDEPMAIAAVTNGEMRRMGGMSDEHAANARLIAAAPDMLEALERLEMTVRIFPSDMDQPESALAMARSALAKARGES